MEKFPNLWTVILAGGNGERLKSFVQGFFGRERPKQYCAFVGTRTMLPKESSKRLIEKASHLFCPRTGTLGTCTPTRTAERRAERLYQRNYGYEHERRHQ